MNYDGQYFRTESLGDISTKPRGYLHESHCYINDTFEQLAATWNKHAEKLAAGRARYQKKVKNVD